MFLVVNPETESQTEELDWDSLIASDLVALPMAIALVLDCSASMYGDKISDAKKVATRFR